MPKDKRPSKPGKPQDKRDGRPRGRFSKGGTGEKPKAQTGDTFEIKMNAMANGGYALGIHNRRPTFIPYAIPGESLRARLIETQEQVDFAAGVELLEASADRVFPECPHFGPNRCWGCQWQHIRYEAQVLLKQDVLADQLYRLGQFEDAIVERALKPIIPSPQKWGYNSHMTLLRDSEGKFGFLKQDGRTINPIELCLILHPELLSLYEMMEIDFEGLKRLQLWRGSDGKTMMVFEMSSEDVPELKTDFPTSINVLLPDNEPVNLLGESAVYYEIATRVFRVTAGGGFRANIPQVENLVKEVLKQLDLREDDAVLDLYAGVGVFSAFIAEKAGLVTLVESYPPMATDAEENLKDFENVDIIEGTVEDVLQSLIENGDTYHAAVIDPPHRGLSKAALDTLITMNIPKLIYINGDVASLSRDVKHFAKHGYELRRIQPFDFSPQTYYVESLVLLVKR
jgi:23S rRNA (uracil1939-C5)-methyltransferase